MSLPSPLCVGIDVSKATLDIAASSAIEQFSVANDADGFDSIIAVLRRHTVALVLMEATGGLEAAVACRLKVLRSLWSTPGKLATLLAPWGIWQRLLVLMLEHLHRWPRLSIAIRNETDLSGLCRIQTIKFSMLWSFADGS